MERKRCVFDSFVLLICIMHMDVGRAATCSDVEYNIGGKCCPLCPSGSHVSKHCTQEAGTSCVSCTEGTFMDQPNGRTNCFPCNTCSAGLKVKTPCTTTSDAVCEPLEGFYCVSPTENGCFKTPKHSICRPGQYMVQRGTSSTDTKCADCTGDTYSDGTFTACKPHTDCKSIGCRLKEPGDHSNDSTCETKSSHFAAVFLGVFVCVVIGGVSFAVSDVCRFGVVVVVGVVVGGVIGVCVIYFVAVGVSCIVSGVYNLVSGIVGRVVCEQVGGVFCVIFHLVSGVVGYVYGLVGGVVHGVYGLVSGVVGSVYNLFSGIVGRVVYEQVGGVMCVVFHPVSGVVGGVYGFVGGVLSLCAGHIVSVVEVCVAVFNGLFAAIGILVLGSWWSILLLAVVLFLGWWFCG